MFKLEEFIADCRDALAADKSHKLVREVVARAVSEPASIVKVLASRRAQASKNSITRPI